MPYILKGMGACSDLPPCPAGFTEVAYTDATTKQPGVMCQNAIGYPPCQLEKAQAKLAVSNTQNQQGGMLLAAAVAVMIFAPGAMKLGALPLAYFGLANQGHL